MPLRCERCGRFVRAYTVPPCIECRERAADEKRQREDLDRLLNPHGLGCDCPSCRPWTY